MTKLSAGSRPPRRLGRLALFALLAVLALGLVAVLALGLLGVVYPNWRWPRRILTVVNESGKPVDDVEVSLGSGPEHYGLGRLRDGGAKSVQVFPGDEDFLTFRFVSDKRAVAWPFGYEEGSIGYRPKLIIGKNGDVRGETGLYSP